MNFEGWTDPDQLKLHAPDPSAGAKTGSPRQHLRSDAAFATGLFLGCMLYHILVNEDAGRGVFVGAVAGPLGFAAMRWRRRRGMPARTPLAATDDPPPTSDARG